MGSLTRYHTPHLLGGSINRYHVEQLGAGVGSLTRYHPTMIGAGISGLSRYHTPQQGGGATEELIKLAGPMAMSMGSEFVKNLEEGKSIAESANMARKGIKRKAGEAIVHYAKNKVKRRVTSARKKVRNIFKEAF